MSTRKANKFYNATEAAEYLGISRQYFYILKRKHKLKPAKRDQATPLFAEADLLRVKEVRDGN